MPKNHLDFEWRLGVIQFLCPAVAGKVAKSPVQFQLQFPRAPKFQLLRQHNPGQGKHGKLFYCTCVQHAPMDIDLIWCVDNRFEDDSG